MPIQLVLEAAIDGGIMTIDVRNTAAHDIIASLELNETNMAASLQVPLTRDQEYVVTWLIKSISADCRIQLAILKPRSASTRIRKTMTPGATDFGAAFFQT